MYKQVNKGIGIVFQDKDSWWVSLVAGLGISYLFYWLLYKVTTITEFFQLAQAGEFGQYGNLYAMAYWTSTIATIVFFSISAASIVWLWKRSLLSKLHSSSNLAGGFIGALGTACPMCGAFLLSSLGVASGVSLFPFQGLELKVASLGLMVGSTIFATKKVAESADCEECKDLPNHAHSHSKNMPVDPQKSKFIILNWARVLIPVLTVMFIINQSLITQTAASMGLKTRSFAQLLGIKTVAAKTIIAPKLNPDKRTTTLVEQPTLSEVPANPNTGDAMADARVVMIPTGKPFYAPDDISFDDPINAQTKWAAYEDSINLTGDLQKRYDTLINTFTCNYCCGSPTSVTVIAQCGCKHAKAWRGYFKYMLQTYGDTYSNEELMGEAFRWTGIWYPKGVLEDYLLATGKSDALPHSPHGGSGSNKNHGL